MKKVAILFIVCLTVLTFSSTYFYSVGIAVSGELFPYFGIYYNSDSFQIGGTLGFICGPNDKNPEEWNYLFSPELNASYFITEKVAIVTSFRTIVVVPYQYEQLYLTGIGLKYSIPVNEKVFNIELSGNFILPFSVGERIWENQNEMNPLIPVPFIKGEYVF